MTQFADITNLTEDARISTMGKLIMEGPKGSSVKPIIIGCMVEDMPKAERYIKKMAEKFPAVRVIDTTEMEHGLVLIRFGEPLR